MRIGEGELGKREDINAHAQSIFFKVLREIAPEVIEDLRGEPYDAYRQARHVYRDEVNFRNLFEEERFAELRRRLEQWGERWRLDAAWCFEKGWAAFQWWEADQDNPEHYDADFWEGDDWTGKAVSLGESATSEEREFSFRYDIDDLSVIKRALVEAEVKRVFDRELKEHLDMLEEAAKERRFEEIPTKRGDEHFRWLVRYQVQGWSMLRIAAEYHFGRKTVEDGIASAAELIDLRRRDPLPPGRPRKCGAQPAE
jgi:hypothetical protein